MAKGPNAGNRSARRGKGPPPRALSSLTQGERTAFDAVAARHGMSARDLLLAIIAGEVRTVLMDAESRAALVAWLGGQAQQLAACTDRRVLLADDVAALAAALGDDMEFAEGRVSTVGLGEGFAAMMAGHFAYYRYEPVAVEEAPRHPYRRNLSGPARGVAHPHRDDLPDDLDSDLGDDLIAVVHAPTGLSIAMGIRSVALARAIIETAMGWPGIDWSRRDMAYYEGASSTIETWDSLVQRIRAMAATGEAMDAGAA